MRTQLNSASNRSQRRGIIIVLTGFLLIGIFAFMALTVDTGRIVLTETEMQNAVDAAALAASQEIAAAVHEAGQTGIDPSLDPNSIAAEAARLMASKVAEANGVFIDPQRDVRFGKRRYDPNTNTWPIDWGANPVNVVQVVARRNNSDSAAPDAALPLAFGWAVGRDSVDILASATAFVEARDMVLVLDFSGSMSDDTEFKAFDSLGQSQVEASIDRMYQQLLDADVRWPDHPERAKWLTEYGEIDSAEGTYVSSNDTNYIFEALGLGDKYPSDDPNFPGQLKYPYPQSGRYSDGTPKGMPSEYTSRNLWKNYISSVKSMGGPYHKKYGYRSLLNYMQKSRIQWYQSEDLWRTSHYPFHAVKNGTSLFLDFLGELDFGDEVGLVSYGTYSVWETTHYDGEVTLDTSSNPITSNYGVIDAIQRRHQAGHYDSYTGMGDGVLKAREMLVGSADDPSDEGHVRYGARPTIILMTDGQANRYPSGWSLPSNFHWNDWTDFDGDGVADYSTSNTNKQYAFYEATEAIRRGITIHTMAVGANADRDIMRAIAAAGDGVFISVPGGSTIAEMESQMIEAFSEIAAKVPPAKLVFEETPVDQL
ncbi:vWA domain-containing protein [Aeoliella mucimassa]|uniref:von Willebrand factor type A domain protein n=1 Tax=Aeoliella mucimassa TaxID=2527972 RepID=A0A518ATS5_9BACT|nr:vWA domain-containing protein [Aeoliella mucimassa]QDU58132.1 von Willebrand factor type A domain protein [Aeoliella mucimassa]